jgi:hypothetical protein
MAQGLEIQWHDSWYPGLDDALHCLPETSLLSRELFRKLVQNPCAIKKRVALVTERKEPVAMVGLRRIWGRWEPLTNWILPGALFPVKEGYTTRVLPALGLELGIGWWRWDFPPPRMRWMRNLQEETTYGMSCNEDFDGYWRKKDRFYRNLRNIRNKCKNFEFRVNDPWMAEWTIRNSESKWRTPGGVESGDLPDRLLVAKYLQERNLHFTLSLHDDGEPVAGETVIVHRNVAVDHVNYRDEKYDRFGAMTRLSELGYLWAKEMGFEGIDLGGTFDYKRNWAPPQGKKWNFNIIPNYIYYQGQFRIYFKRSNS